MLLRVCRVRRAAYKARAGRSDPREAPLARQVAKFVSRQAASHWAGPALVCLALFVVLFALAGQTVNAPFVYYSPR